MQAAQAQVAQNLRPGTERKQHQAHHGDTRPVMGLPERRRERVIGQSPNLRLSSQTKNTSPGDQSKRQPQARRLRHPQRAKTEQGSDQYQQQHASTAEAPLKLIERRMRCDDHGESNDHQTNHSYGEPTAEITVVASHRRGRF